MQQQNSDLWAITREALAERVRAEGQGPEVAQAIDIDARFMTSRKADDPAYTIEGGIAMVDIAGTLVQRDPWWGDITYDDAAAAVLAAAADPGARAVLVRIDSPGGTVAGVTRLVDAMRTAGKQKKVYAYTEGTLCSGAYWPAAQACKIGAERTAQVGSIGVVTVHNDFSRALDKAGVKVSFITSGKYKAMGNDAEPLGDDAREYIQGRIDAIYRIFVEDVAEGRKLDTDSADAWADGRIFPAAGAKETGLVDRVESLEEFIKFIREDSKMKPEELRAQHPDTWQQVYDKGIAAANEENKAVTQRAVDEALASERAEASALVGAMFGEAAAKQFSDMQAAGVTAQQLSAMKAAGIVGTPAEENSNADSESRQAILDGLTAAANQPVEPGAQRAANGSGDDFEAKVAAYQESKGVSRAQAMRIVGQKFPKLRDKWLAEKNRR